MTLLLLAGTGVRERVKIEHGKCGAYMFNIGEAERPNFHAHVGFWYSVTCYF